MWHIYVLRCSDGSLYTGITTNLKRRLDEHNGMGQSGARFTRMKRPVVLVYQETALSRSRALTREAAIKKLTHQEKELLIGGRKE